MFYLIISKKKEGGGQKEKEKGESLFYVRSRPLVGGVNISE